MPLSARSYVSRLASPVSRRRHLAVELTVLLAVEKPGNHLGRARCLLSPEPNAISAVTVTQIIQPCEVPGIGTRELVRNMSLQLHGDVYRDQSCRRGFRRLSSSTYAESFSSHRIGCRGRFGAVVVVIRAFFLPVVVFLFWSKFVC